MLELYHHGSSACAAKVRMVLAEKELDWTGHYIDILNGEQFTNAYRKINPKCIVPTLVDDGLIIPESTVICEYLDTKFPEVKLIPEDPVDAMKVRLCSKAVDEEIHPATRVVTYAASHRFHILALSEEDREAFINSPIEPARREAKRRAIYDGFEYEEAKGALMTFVRAFEKMEEALAENEWLVGDTYTFADAALSIYVNRIDCLSMAGIWEGKMPHLEAWWEKIKARPSFHPAIFEWLPEELRDSMKTNGARSWPQAEAIIDAERVKAQATN